jgi:hypothetical protein
MVMAVAEVVLEGVRRGPTRGAALAEMVVDAGRAFGGSRAGMVTTLEQLWATWRR